LALGRRFRRVRQQPGAGQQGHAAFFRQGAGGVLEAEIAHLRGCRAYENDAGGRAGFRETGVLAQEAVAGMDGPRLGAYGGRQDFLRVQIGCRGLRGPDAIGFIASRNVQGTGVRFRINGNGSYSHGTQCAGDAAGDFAAIGYQDFSEHASSFVGRDQGATAGGSQISRRMGVGLYALHGLFS
jgi:hypothetical protein